MWQRVQTIFLVLIIVVMAVFLFVPIWQETLGAEQTNTLTAFSLIQTGAEAPLTITFPYLFVGIAAIIVMIVAGYEIVRYDNRLTQLKLGALNSLLMAVVLLLSVWFMIDLENELSPASRGEYQIGLFLPMVAMLLNVFANRFIRRDEKLVRSVDRIR